MFENSWRVIHFDPVRVIVGMKGAKIVQQVPNYIYATYTIKGS